MTIGINGNEANVTHRVGVGQYAFELLRNIYGILPEGIDIIVYLENPPVSDLPAEKPNWEYKVLGPGKLWTLTKLQAELIRSKLKGHGPDIFFTPTHYAPLFMPVPSVISVMDVSYESYPQYFKKRDLFQLKLWTALSVKSACKIFTISRFSKEEIIKYYRYPEKNIVVTYPGIDNYRFNPEINKEKDQILAVRKRYGIMDKYIIYLGTLQPKKNLTRLVEAFGRLPRKDLHLVIAGMVSEGRGGWMYQEIFDKVKELGLSDRVIFTGYVPDYDVPYLFSGAQLYILPSLYEGFGIPPVEAMAAGVPVVVSRVASLPEICGKAVVYIDNPQNSEEISIAIEKVLALSAPKRAAVIKLGQKQAAGYNWKSTARQALSELVSIIKSDAER